MRTVVRSPAFVRVESFAHSRAALAAMSMWAFAEGLAWPVIPDFFIFPLALAAPRRGAAFFLVALAGSVSGELLAYLGGGTPYGSELLGAAPLVTERMVDAARSALQDDGAAGLLSQPLSGIPYKVFASQAEPAGLGLPEYLGMSALARGGRFLVVTVARPVGSCCSGCGRGSLGRSWSSTPSDSRWGLQGP
ncbi:MAG: YqaA family protein [Actinomycetota bacterium]